MDKTHINKRVQARYDFLMEQGKHGHYENMFKCVHEELKLQTDVNRQAVEGLVDALVRARRTLNEIARDEGISDGDTVVAINEALAEYESAKKVG